MVWSYYDTELPLKSAIEDISFAMRSDEKTVRLLLRHYFKDTPEGWIHTRCEREITEFKSKGDKARNSANARWKNANALPTHSERNANECVSYANQEPITNNHIKSKTGEKPPPTNSTPETQGETEEPEFDTVAFIFDAGLKILGAKNRALIGMARKKVGDQKTTEILASMAAMRPAVSEPVAYFMAAITPKVRGLVL